MPWWSETLAFPEARPTLQAVSGTKIRIALADDHPIFRDGLRRLLSVEPDLEIVAEADNGQDVVGMIQKHQPDLLLLDLNMPGLDGLSLLQRFQSLQCKTKIILLTASEDEQAYVQAMKSGTSGIVLKQSATRMLINSIRKVHEGEVWLDSKTTAVVMKQFCTPADSALKEKDGSALSNREREIVRLVSQGCKNRDIAEKLFISEGTVKNHLHNVFQKLGVTDRVELALHAIQHNIHA